MGAIIFDHQEDNTDNMIDMVQDETDRTTNIPSFFLLGKDGCVACRCCVFVCSVEFGREQEASR